MGLPLYPSCKDCGEYRVSALHIVADRVICASCSEVSMQNGTCDLCERQGPVELHHIAGRLSASDVVPLCLNCHRCETAVRAGQRSIWQDDECPGLHLLQGWVNYFTVLADHPPARDTFMRGVAPILGTIMAVLILLHLFAPELAPTFRLQEGSLSWVNEELGVSVEDWERTRWPDGITCRALRQWCLSLVVDAGV